MQLSKYMTPGKLAWSLACLTTADRLLCWRDRLAHCNSNNSVPSPHNFNTSEKTLAANWVRLDGDPCQAHFTASSLEASPDRKKWKVRNKYKEHRSATYVHFKLKSSSRIRSNFILVYSPFPTRSQNRSNPQEV